MNTKTFVTNQSTYDVKSSMVQCIQYMTSHTKDYGCVVIISSTKHNCCFNQDCMISMYEVMKVKKFLH
jgi:hypothetical protein